MQRRQEATNGLNGQEFVDEVLCGENENVSILTKMRIALIVRIAIF